MIDTDTLAACATEIVRTPQVFTHRDRLKARAASRLKGLITKVHDSVLRGLALPAAQRKARKAALAVAFEEVRPTLELPGFPRLDRRAFDRVLGSLSPAD
jgi:hypothetical protein